MTSNAQKLGNLMLHSANSYDDAIAFRNPRNNKIQKVTIPQSAHRTRYSGSFSSTSDSTDGKAMCSLDLQRSHYGQMILSVTFEGYITSGSWYWSWGLYNNDTSNFLPIIGQSIGNYAVSHAKNRTTSGLMGNQTDNCIVPYVGHVHTWSSQNWVAFDASNEGATNNIQLRMAAASGAGDTWYSNASQTLYARNVTWVYGTVTGNQYDNTFST